MSISALMSCNWGKSITSSSSETLLTNDMAEPVKNDCESHRVSTFFPVVLSSSIIGVAVEVPTGGSKEKERAMAPKKTAGKKHSIPLKNKVRPLDGVTRENSPPPAEVPEGQDQKVTEDEGVNLLLEEAENEMEGDNDEDDVLSSTSESVVVVLRVRPLNSREKEMKSSICVSHSGKQQITIDKPDSNGDKTNTEVLKNNNFQKTFTFDHVFTESSTQSMVYKETGRRILQKCLKGLNGCIFAYGQTGSGKTFTMEGSVEDPGVMHRLTKDMFDHFKSITKKKDYTVKASYLEIYNESLRDLLAQHNGVYSDSNELKVREDKLKGIYVAGLADTPINSFEDIRKLIESCTKYRTKGETKMNAVSSRSHAVLTLYIAQQDKDDKEGYTEMFHKINLIDLAGSERARDTGARGHTLKEGAKINQSLSSLGNVINALVQGRGHIPYRDSKLTRLLMDSLGGNSVTLLVAAMSPATVNYEESLSTLQFADRAKNIKNKVHINRDPKLQRIAELLAENRRLKKRIEVLESMVDGKQMERMEELERQVEEKDKIIAEQRSKKGCCSIM